MCDPLECLLDIFDRFITVQVKESDAKGYFATFQHIYPRNILVCFNPVSCLWGLVTCSVRYLQKTKHTSKTKRSMEKVKKHENKGIRLDFAEHETKKGKRDSDTCWVWVSQVQKHTDRVRFGRSCLLHALLCSESEKRTLFLPKWSRPKQWQDSALFRDEEHFG